MCHSIHSFWISLQSYISFCDKSNQQTSVSKIFTNVLLLINRKHSKLQSWLSSQQHCAKVDVKKKQKMESLFSGSWQSSHQSAFLVWELHLQVPWQLSLPFSTVPCYKSWNGYYCDIKSNVNPDMHFQSHQNKSNNILVKLTVVIWTVNRQYGKRLSLESL